MGGGGSNRVRHGGPAAVHPLHLRARANRTGRLGRDVGEVRDAGVRDVRDGGGEEGKEVEASDRLSASGRLRRLNLSPYTEASPKDRQGNLITTGDRILWTPEKSKPGNPRKGTVLAPHTVGVMLDVVLDGDPFGTYVRCERIDKIESPPNPEHNWLVENAVSLKYKPNNRQINQNRNADTKMATTKPNTRDLRKQAKAAQISGWEDMSVTELQAALDEHAEANGNGAAKPAKAASKAVAAREEVRGSKTRKSTAQKEAVKATKRAKADDEDEDEDTGPIPFKAGTNMYLITEALMKGGKRKDLVKSLKKKVDLKPRTKGDDEFDLDSELDRRILIIGQILRKDHGWDVTREGRGFEDGTIVATPPE